MLIAIVHGKGEIHSILPFAAGALGSWVHVLLAVLHPRALELRRDCGLQLVPNLGLGHSLALAPHNIYFMHIM